jgi:hypothetical protein
MWLENCLLCTLIRSVEETKIEMVTIKKVIDVENVTGKEVMGSKKVADLPDYWTSEQKRNFAEKESLGCKTCKHLASLGPEKAIQDMNLSKVWINMQVT